MKKISSLLLLLVLYESVNAQISTKYDTISVTAARFSESVTETGKSVSVITAQEISELPVQSVDDLLRELPGININARQGFGVQADVGIRGSTFSQVLFLLDNTPLNDPLTAHFNINIPVALSEIGQIELIRGPASTAYGADAVGGVVHIKTKAYLDAIRSPSGMDEMRMNADLSVGQHALRILEASAGYGKDNWKLNISARKALSDGEELINPAYAQGLSPETHFNTYFDVQNISAAFSMSFTDELNFYVRSGLENRDFNARFFYTRSPFDESAEEINSAWVLSTLALDKEKQRSEISISYRQTEDIYDFNSAISPVNEHTTGLLYLNASHQFELLNNNESINTGTLMFGAQLQNKQIESTDRGNHETASAGFYAINNLKFHSGLNLTSSLRLQYNEVSEFSLLPQISFSMPAGDFIFRGSAGRAVREADFTERYISTALTSLTPLRNLGNPELLPEVSTTVDLGADWIPLSNLRLITAVFYRSSSDLIDYTLLNSNDIPNNENLQPNEEYFYASNISETDVYGLELSAELLAQISSSATLSSRIGYTRIETQSDENTISRYIANHPSDQLHLKLSLTVNRFSLQSLSNYYVRSEEADAFINAKVPSSYFISNIKAAVQPFDYNLHFYVEVMNVTDTRYQELLGAPMPGRWVLGGVRYSL